MMIGDTKYSLCFPALNWNFWMHEWMLFTWHTVIFRQNYLRFGMLIISLKKNNGLMWVCYKKKELQFFYWIDGKCSCFVNIVKKFRDVNVLLLKDFINLTTGC